MSLITFTERGFYCAQGGFYIDPWLPVDRAVITHGHSDHAHRGSRSYLAHNDSLNILKLRLGPDAVIETLAYYEPVYMNGVSVTLFPAGHIIGSAQVRVEYKGEIWVVSGDYKTQYDGVCTAFEPVRCHSFVTESTFALPVYAWKEQALIFEDIHRWVQQNQASERNSVLVAYTLGKSQRLIHGLSPYGYEWYAHGATVNMHEAIRPYTVLPDIHHLTAETPKDDLQKGIILVPGSAADSPWMRRWQPYSLGICSGWMQVRGAQRRRNADAGFALSDHADWEGLIGAVAATGAEHVYATHGFSNVLARYLREEKGLDAEVVRTQYGEEEE